MKWLEEFKFDSPSGIALDGSDNLYVSDTNNHKIYRFDANGKNVTNCNCSFGGFGFLSNNLYFPSGIDVDDDKGDVYVVDEGNNVIKKFIVNETNVIRKFIGNEINVIKKFIVKEKESIRFN